MNNTDNWFLESEAEIRVGAAWLLFAFGLRVMSFASVGVAGPLVPTYKFSLIALPFPEMTATPFCVLKPMVFAAPAAVPPIVLFAPLMIKTPVVLPGPAASPVGSIARGRSPRSRRCSTEH